jgi:DNA-binding MurR/RpiR family transcriptional regulator
MTAKHEKLLAALLCSPTIQGAAKVAGISEATALRYLKEAEFSDAYRDARREVVSHALTGLQAACSEAVKTLREVATDITAPASSRVSAAKSILEMSVRSIELDDLAARVETLEAMQEREGANR